MSDQLFKINRLSEGLWKRQYKAEIYIFGDQSVLSWLARLHPPFGSIRYEVAM